ncbi:hypothetical protein HYPSUDRAFT_931758 [Hypholoma sublateritium FD-334 SS-4]|uniref:Uncharacterized protein n=1 Tax=Hypholoma sublateritium (strain FD-334 SS-4) TaxID=945553 RepID=A0A0D2PFP9_HYPSF|nr:hypothetical protein HYPSUDRAFT_931758 [Hypholoma sublateritium FD-334 SS-4]
MTSRLVPIKPHLLGIPTCRHRRKAIYSLPRRPQPVKILLSRVKSLPIQIPRRNGNSKLANTSPSQLQEKRPPAFDIRSTTHHTSLANGKAISNRGRRLFEQHNAQPITAKQFSGKKPPSFLKFKKSSSAERLASISVDEPVSEQAMADPLETSKPQTTPPAVGAAAPTPTSLNNTADYDYIAKLVCQRVGEMFTSASQQTPHKRSFPWHSNASFPPGHSVAPHQEHGFRGNPAQTDREFRGWNNGPRVYHNRPDAHPYPRRINNFVRRPQSKPYPYNRYGRHEHSQPFEASPNRVLQAPDGRHQERQSWNRRETDVRNNQDYLGYLKPEQARPFRQPSDKAYYDHMSRGQYVTRGRSEAVDDRVGVHPAANEKVDELVQKGDSKESGGEYGQRSPPFESHQSIIALCSSEVQESLPPIPQPSKMVSAHTKPRPEHAPRQRSPPPFLQHGSRDTTRAPMNTEGSNETSTDSGSFRTPSPSLSMDVYPWPSSPPQKSPQSPQINIATTSEDQDIDDDDWEGNYGLKEDEIQQSPAKFRVDPSREREDDVQMYDNPWLSSS